MLFAIITTYTLIWYDAHFAISNTPIANSSLHPTYFCCPSRCPHFPTRHSSLDLLSLFFADLEFAITHSRPVTFQKDAALALKPRRV